MELAERIALCKQCKNRSFDPSQGIICRLTNEKPTFEVACRHFLRDEAIGDQEVFQGNYTGKENRGGCLTAVLVLIIIGATINIFSSLIIIVSRPAELLNLVPLHLYIVSLLSGGLALAGAILMFQWKKTGIYLYGSYLLITILVQIQIPGFQLINLGGILIGLLILFAVIGPKWSNFE